MGGNNVGGVVSPDTWELSSGVNGFELYDVQVNGASAGRVVVVGAVPSVPYGGFTPNSEYWDVDLALMDGNAFVLGSGTDAARGAKWTHRWRIDRAAPALGSASLPQPRSWSMGSTYLHIDHPGATVWVRANLQEVGPGLFVPLPGAATVSGYVNIEQHLDWNT